MTKTRLHLTCRSIDEILANHQVSISVIDVYFSDNTLLFLLTEATFLNTEIMQDLKKALKNKDVLALGDSILVHNYVHSTELVNTNSNVIEREFHAIVAQPVATLDVMELIAIHEDKA